MRLLLKIWTKNGLPEAICMLEDDGTCRNIIEVPVKHIFNIKKYVKKHNAIKWRISFDCRLFRFLWWFGRQNDYLYPHKGASHPEIYPFKKAHLWKTRFGFETSCRLSE